MNQIEIFRKQLESYSQRNSHHQRSPSRVVDELIKKLPEEEMDEVKAYRSARFLTEFLSQYEVDEPDSIGGRTLEEHLFSLIGQVQEDAIDGILQRLEEESLDFGSEVRVYDPISKVSQNITDSGDDTYDIQREYFARDILEQSL